MPPFEICAIEILWLLLWLTGTVGIAGIWTIGGTNMVTTGGAVATVRAATLAAYATANTFGGIAGPQS